MQPFFALIGERTPKPINFPLRSRQRKYFRFTAIIPAKQFPAGFLTALLRAQKLVYKQKAVPRLAKRSVPVAIRDRAAAGAFSR